MGFLNDRRMVLVLAGAAIALLAGVAIAWTLVSQHRGETAVPPPASRAGLVIDSTGPAADARMDAAKPLRCFVTGQFVGEMTLAACAKRNGVSTDALDVGLDQTGALAAAEQAGAMITPLPPADAKPEEAAPAEAAPAPALPQVVNGGAPAACQSYAQGQWRRMPTDMALNACVQALFAGRCEHAGEAAYGRWGQQTLRLLAPGRVEIAADNRNFRPLTDQPGCPGPPAG